MKQVLLKSFQAQQYRIWTEEDGKDPSDGRKGWWWMCFFLERSFVEKRKN